MLPTYSVPTMHNSYLFCISLPRIITLCLFNDSHSDMYQVNLSVVLIALVILNMFSCAHICVYTHTHKHTHIYKVEKCLFRTSAYSKIIFSCSFDIELYEFFGFPGGSDSKESVCNVGDPDLIPGSERSLEKGMTTHSSLGKTMDRETWWATIHGVAKS